MGVQLPAIIPRAPYLPIKKSVKFTVLLILPPSIAWVIPRLSPGYPQVIPRLAHGENHYEEASYPPLSPPYGPPYDDD